MDIRDETPDFGQRLADRYEDAREKAELLSDELGERVFSYAEKLVQIVIEEAPVELPQEEAASLMETAILKQEKWSPLEAKPKWNLALAILHDEKVSLSFLR